MEDHNRSRTRVIYSAYVLVKSYGKKTVEGRVRDISIDALYLQIKPVFEIDEQVKVEIVLYGKDSELTIKVPAKVMRKDENGIALRFITQLEWWPIFTFFPFHSLDDDKKILDS